MRRLGYGAVDPAALSAVGTGHHDRLGGCLFAQGQDPRRTSTPSDPVRVVATDVVEIDTDRGQDSDGLTDGRRQRLARRRRLVPGRSRRAIVQRAIGEIRELDQLTTDLEPLHAVAGDLVAMRLVNVFPDLLPPELAVASCAHLSAT